MSVNTEPLQRVEASEGIEQEVLKQGRPIVISGWFDSRPRLKEWSFETFAERFPDRTVTAGLTTEDSKLVLDDKTGIPQIELTLAEYMERLRSPNPGCYLLSPVQERLPELIEEIEAPPLVTESLWHTSRLWISAGGTCSQLHRDWGENFFIQVEGRKRFTFVDRRQSRYVYTRPFYSGVPNFSRVDDAEEPDLERFPDFEKADRIIDTIETGEVLYLPRLWWHQVRSLTPCISVNLWFGRGMVGMVAKMSEAYAKLRGLRA